MSWDGFAVQAQTLQGHGSDLRARRASAIEKRMEAESKVLHLLRNAHSEWVEGSPALQMPDSEVQKILGEIDDVYTGSMRRWAVNFLVRGLERGKRELGWKVRVPPYVMAFKQPGPALDAKHFALLTPAARLRHALIERWSSMPEGAAVEAIDVVLSAVALSAVTTRERRRAWIAHLATGLRVDADPRRADTDASQRPARRACRSTASPQYIRAPHVRLDPQRKPALPQVAAIAKSLLRSTVWSSPTPSTSLRTLSSGNMSKVVNKVSIPRSRA